MKPLILFFLKYLLAPLFAMLLLFITSALKSVRQKLSMKKVIVFSLLTGLCLGLPSLFGLLRNEFVWGGLVLTVISYLFCYCIESSDERRNNRTQWNNQYSAYLHIFHCRYVDLLSCIRLGQWRTTLYSLGNDYCMVVYDSLFCLSEFR